MKIDETLFQQFNLSNDERQVFRRSFDPKHQNRFLLLGISIGCVTKANKGKRTKISINQIRTLIPILAERSDLTEHTVQRKFQNEINELVDQVAAKTSRITEKRIRRNERKKKKVLKLSATRSVRAVSGGLPS